jgi:AcrR family transcriptional regulator
MSRQARAEITRLRLLEASVEALVAKGYAGTTTQEVCRRAGCSRGTMLYHFPKREDLLVAALHHVLSNRVIRFVDEHRGEQPLDAPRFLESLWSHWQGPELVAWLELAVAARTNAALRAPMRETMQDFDRQILGAFRALQPLGPVPKSLEEPALMLTFAVLNGLAVSQSYEADGPAGSVMALLAGMSALIPQSEVVP